MRKECITCGVILTTQNYSKNSFSYCKCCKNKKVKAYAAKLKRDIFEAYGNKCVCCGEDTTVFLTIDHINGDGAEHRRQLSPETNGKSAGGVKFYLFLKRNNYPKDKYQLLCMNCNFAKHILGTCPHQDCQSLNGL